ncbi:MAG: SusD/RagB family nutrient-binding outer membrane lipoprotein [Bacteroidetes bacterium]|nr:MAG: SusD/RagB family nutrient-binding outer membrane lipoprotein [Bacteroidota bacterium]
MKSLKSLIYVLLASVLVSTTSCQLVETNIDPTRPDDVAISLILPSMLSQAAYNQLSNPARVAGIVMQYFEGVDAQQLQYTTYIIAEDAFNNYWRTGLYAGVLKDCKVVIDKAQAEGRPIYEGIAKVIMANEYGIAASYFGDIPFSQALLGAENLNPAYDTQEEVYAGVIALLDEAIALLGQPPSDAPPAADDLIFGGDIAAWVATANALKARYLLHLTKRDPQAATKAQAALANAFGSLDEQPNFAWTSAQTANNPLAKFGIERPNTLAIASSFSDALTAAADPRQPYYVSGASGFYNASNTDIVWSQNTSVIPIISFVEVKFMEAEVLLRTGGTDEAISAALAEAITASMEQIAVASSGAASIDPADYQAYVDAQSSLAGLTTTDEKLNRIMTEAYYAYYGYNFHQTWTNYRRTGYPAIVANPAAERGLNPSGIVPRRFLYPVSEAQLNAEQLNAAKARQDTNGDGEQALLDDDTWAFN